MSENPTDNEHLSYPPKLWPHTVQEAVDLLLQTLDEDSKKAIRAESKQGMYKYHLGLGMYVRNQFGLWQNNEDLLKSCGGEWLHPDDHQW